MNDATPVKRRASAARDRLAPQDLIKIFELLHGANSVELKLIVADSEHAAFSKLGFDPVEAEPRQTYFFDTPDLALNAAGLIVRARRSPGGKGDTVIKRRPVDPAEIEDELRHDAAFKVEVDVMPGGFVCSASAKGRCTGQEILDACEGRAQLEKIFSREQRKFYAAHAPAGIALNDLVPLGPTFLLRLKQQPKNFDRPITVELWLYPDGSRLLEISTKGEPAEAFQLGAVFKTYLLDGGFTLQRGTSKTSSALSYFSKKLKA